MSNITDLCKQINTSYKNIYTKYWNLSAMVFGGSIQHECINVLFGNIMFKTPNNQYIYIKCNFENNIYYDILFTKFIFDKFPFNDFTIVNEKYLKERVNRYELITIDQTLQIFTECKHIQLQTLTNIISKDEYDNSLNNKINVDKINVSFKYQKEIEMLKNYNICITEHQNLINQFIEKLSKFPKLIMESAYDYIVFINEIKCLKANKTDLSYCKYDKLTHKVLYETMPLLRLLTSLINKTYNIVGDNENISKILKTFDTYK